MLNIFKHDLIKSFFSRYKAPIIFIFRRVKQQEDFKTEVLCSLTEREYRRSLLPPLGENCSGFSLD